MSIVSVAEAGGVELGGLDGLEGLVGLLGPAGLDGLEGLVGPAGLDGLERLGGVVAGAAGGEDTAVVGVVPPGGVTGALQVSV